MSNTRKLPKDNPNEEQLQPTAVGGWKKNNGRVVTLPSGNNMRIRPVGITDLAHKGLIPNSLMGIIMDSVKAGQQPRPDQILSDDVNISDMFEMMDKAIIMMAVEPQVYPVPEGGERTDEELYVDELGDDDKMFLWHIATGGTADVEQFRKERTGVLASLPGQPTVASPAKRAAPRKR